MDKDAHPYNSLMYMKFGLHRTRDTQCRKKFPQTVVFRCLEQYDIY